MVFLVFQQKSKKHRVFWFFTRDRTKKQKYLVFFVFHLKSNLDFCWKNQKHLGKPKKTKVSGPSPRFWIFGFVGFGFRRRHFKTKNPKIQILSEGPQTFGFVGFPRVFSVSVGSCRSERFWIFGFLFFWFPPS